MATNYDPNTNTTTTTPTVAKRTPWGLIAAAVVALGIIVMLAMPDRSGTEPTTGTSPAATDTMPPAATDTMPPAGATPAPATPAAPY